VCEIGLRDKEVKHLEISRHFIKVRGQELIDFVENWQVVHKEFKKLIKAIKRNDVLIVRNCDFKEWRIENLKENIKEMKILDQVEIIELDEKKPNVLKDFVKQRVLDKELMHYEDEAIKLLLQLVNLYRCITNLNPNKQSKKLMNKRMRRLNRIKQGLKPFGRSLYKQRFSKMMDFEIKKMIMEEDLEMKKLKKQRNEE
jgi:hypothetical protein